MNKMGIRTWLDNRKSNQHELLKNKIKALQEIRYFAFIHKHPQAERDRIDKKIAKLQRKLNKTRVTYFLGG